MQIYDDRKKRVGTLARVANLEITKTLNTGDREVSFEYPINGELVNLLKEEYYIRTKEDEYVLKEIEIGGKYNKYTAVLNVEELEGAHFPYGFASKEQTIRACLDFAFEGTGWKVRTCTITKRRTIDIEEKTTAWEVLQQCLKTYRCECKIDSINKRIDIYEQIGEDRGCYFMEGLNLRNLSVKSDTYDFYTRIFPIGKDGITIEWLNGKPYLENYQYSKKVKTYVWKDERYTNTTSLIEDAAAKLEEMSKPYKVYTADVADLAASNQVYKDILDYGIGDTIILVSRKTKTRERQRIVKIVEYPDNPEKNTVELSNITKTFAEVQKTETELAKQEAISITKSSTKKLLGEYPSKSEVETWITASEDKISMGVDEKLEEYSTKSETETAISLEIGKLNLGVYQTKEDMEEYYTKTQTDSSITAEIGKLNLAVYQKKEDMKGYATEESLSEIALDIGEIEISVNKKVGADEIIAKINMSPETVAINADKITLEGLVTANKNFKILTDGSMEAQNGKFNGTIESKEAVITGGYLTLGSWCYIKSNGALYAVSPNYVSGVKIGKLGTGSTDIKTYFESIDYGLAMQYIGNTFYIGSNSIGDISMKNIYPQKVYSYGDVTCLGDFVCTGTKNREVETKDFGYVKQYCYEMASPFFGDLGSGKINEAGECYIFLDTKFMQTIETEHEYLIFLTAAGEGDIYTKKKEITKEYFVVRGTPGLEFFWEVKAKQKGYENNRMEQAEEPEKQEPMTEEDQMMINEMNESFINIQSEIGKDEMEVAEMEAKIMEELEWMEQE